MVIIPGGLDSLLKEKRLVPILNQTKWKELILALSNLPHLEPPVRIKYVEDEKPPTVFVPIWWEQLEQIDYSVSNGLK